MPHKKNRHTRITIIALLLAIAAFCSYSQQAAPVTDPRIPGDLSAELYKYKADDNLASWLHCCSTFIAAEPQEHYFLYAYMGKNLWRTPRHDTTECKAWFSYLLYHAYDALKIKGDVPESKDNYEAALRFYDTAHSYIPRDSSFVAAYLLKPLGNIYTRMGDYKSALLVHRLNSDILRCYGDSAGLASTYGNMAVALRWQDSLHAALLQAQAGLALSVPGTIDYAYLKSITAEIYLCDSQFSLANQENQVAIQLYQKHLGDPEDALRAAEGLSACMSTATEILIRETALKAAEDQGRKTLNFLARYFPAGHNREKAIGLRRLGDIYTGLADPVRALSCYDSAIRQLVPGYTGSGKPLFADNTLIDAFSGRSAALVALQREEEGLDALMMAAGMEQQLRLSYHSENAKLEQLQRARQRTEHILELAYTLYSRGKEEKYHMLMLQQVERSKAQLLMEQWIRNNEAGNSAQAATALRERISYYRQWLATNDTGTASYSYISQRLKEAEFTLSRQDIQGYQANRRLAGIQDSAGPQRILDAIPEDMLVLDYFAGRRHLYVLELTRGSITGIHVADSADAWRLRTEQYLEQWYYRGPEPMSARPSLFCKASADLYRYYIPEIEWEKYRNCLIIPDDYLCRLPFEALQTAAPATAWNPGTWPYFLKKTHIRYNFSLQLWHEQQQRLKTSTEKQEAGVSGYFVADFVRPWPPLPEVKQEYRQARQICDIAYLDKEASKRRLLQSLQQYRIVHISTHGTEQGPDHSPALVLGDSMLYAWELGHTKSSAPLVVLNTCRGADGDLQQGEGVVSMARYLTASGFPGVIASIWNVNDQSGAALIQSFYRRLQREHSPATALQQAKEQWLEHQDIPATEKTPYYWAGFVYTGAEQELRLKQQVSRILVLSLSGAFCALAVGVYSRKRRKKKRAATA